MLTALRVWCSLQAQGLRTGLVVLLSRRWTTGLTIVVIALTLSLPTLFWILTHQLQQLTASWQRAGHISLYLSLPITNANQQSLLVRVQNTPGVKAVTLKSAMDGLKELQQQADMQDIAEYLPDNPLPPVLDVIPADDLQTPAQLEQLLQTLQAYPQVEQAKMDLQWMNQIYRIIAIITQVTHTILLLLAVAVILIIANTLRLTIQNRHEEIQVLKLIGAPDLFILRPFLYMGMAYGLLGALLAICIVNGLCYSLQYAMVPLTTLFHIPSISFALSWVQASGLMVIALFLGWFAARLSVKRQLMAVEPKAD